MTEQTASETGQHTPEPWRWLTNLHAFGALKGAYIDDIAGTTRAADVLSHGGVGQERCEANARRIVACVNACKGIMIALRTERDTLREEKAELLAVLQEWRGEMWPLCEDGWIEGLRNLPMKDQLDWYETDGNIFTEARLYKALGKEDARSVLGIWRRFRFIAEHLRAATDKAKGGAP